MSHHGASPTLARRVVTVQAGNAEKQPPFARVYYRLVVDMMRGALVKIGSPGGAVYLTTYTQN